MPKLSAVKLTKRVAESAEPAASDRFLWDSEVRGFGLRVYATAKTTGQPRRTFVFQYLAPVPQRLSRRVTLGAFPAITVEQARELAKAAAGKLANGIDPQADSDVEPKPDPKLSDLFPQYLAEVKAKKAERTFAEYNRLWEKNVEPSFGKRRLGQVSVSEVAQWHTAAHERPVLANRCLELLSGFFAWAEKRGLRPRHSNPCSDVGRYDEQRRGQSLKANEYSALGEALTRAETVGVPTAPKLRKVSTKETKNRRPKSADKPKKASPVVVSALRFLALTGWREQEVCQLRRADVDFERRVATLQETKTKRSERPLGELALELLRQQPTVKGNPYFFPGEASGRNAAERVGKALSDPKHTWQNVRHAAALSGESPLRLHDLRHSFATVARDLGYGDHVIAKLIGHKLSGQTSRYGGVADSVVLAAADAITTAIDAHMGGEMARRKQQRTES